MKKLRVCVVIGLLALAATGQTSRVEKPPLTDDFLDRQVEGDELEYETTSDAFQSMLLRTRVPGGMVRTIDCFDDTLKQSWRPLNSPLHQALNAIVRVDPRYRWEHKGGTINLLPAKGEPALLEIRIGEFHVENVSSAMEALDQLLARPEVERAMTDLHLQAGVRLIIGPVSPAPRRFSVHCKEVTLRSALNAIACGQGQAIWRYVEIHCAGRNEVVVSF